MIQGKVWGTTTKIRDGLYCLIIDEGAYCSMHKHLHRWNGFFVVSGRLQIEVEKRDYDLTDTTVLQTDELTHVPPGEYHRFHALEPTIAIEFYWVEMDDHDIERKDVGGVECEKDNSTETANVSELTMPTSIGATIGSFPPGTTLTQMASG